jgi:hypothetical protein
VGIWMLRWGLLPAHEWLQDRRQREQSALGHVNTETHDSLFASVPVAWAWDYVTFLVERLERARQYRVRETTVDFGIPCTIRVGRRWGTGHEWKRLPSRREFEEVARGLSEEPA